MTPKVSILIACHNEGKRIVECLHSLLLQDLGPLEIIVADDGSTDDTAALAEAIPKVRVLRLPHRGKAKTVNQAAGESLGSILLFLDGDMVFQPDYVRRLVQPILDGQEIGTCHGTEYVANPEGRWSRCWQLTAGLPPNLRLSLTDREASEGSIVFRAILKSEFMRVGGFNDTGYLDDQTLFAKLGVKARFVKEAVCRHYNVETLSEVYALGRWQGKSIAYLHGSRALLGFFPLFAFWHAGVGLYRHGYLPMASYILVHRWGAFTGILGFVWTGGKTYGR